MITSRCTIDILFVVLCNNEAKIKIECSTLRSWKEEEEAEETPANPRSAQTEVGCSSSSISWHHRLCSFQSLPLRKDCLHGSCLGLLEETPGLQEEQWWMVRATSRGTWLGKLWWLGQVAKPTGSRLGVRWPCQAGVTKEFLVGT